MSSWLMGSWRWKPSLSVVVISQMRLALRSRVSSTIPLYFVMVHLFKHYRIPEEVNHRWLFIIVN